MNIYKVILNNKKAFFLYEILEKIEAGIVLYGTEIKSCRMGKLSFSDTYAKIDKNNQLFLYNLYIAPYEKGNIFNRDPLRPKRLLLHKKEIIKLSSKLNEKGLTLLPLKIYINGKGLLKVELGLGRGKNIHDKRESIKKREDSINMKRELGKKVRNKR